MSDPQDRLRQESATLWRVSGFGRERHPPGSGYWFENRGREPQVVFQYAVAGWIHYRDQARQLHRVPAGSALLFVQGEDTAYGLPRHANEAFVTEFIALVGAGVREHWHLLCREGAALAIDAGGPLLPAMRRLMELAAPGSGCDATTMAQEAFAFTMMLFTSRRQALSLSQSPVERAVDALLRQPTSAWSLKQLADHHGVSREHLTRTFHQRLGEAPTDYLGRVRLERALHLLRQTILPVAEVARQAGYASTHTLARQVRAVSGLSPRALRASAAAPQPSSEEP